MKELIRKSAYVPIQYTTTLTGAAETTSIASRLILESVSFEVMPLPDDQWEISVKSDARMVLWRAVNGLEPA